MKKITDLEFKAVVFALQDAKKQATADQIRAAHVRMTGELIDGSSVAEQCRKFLRPHPTIKNTFLL